MNPNVIRSDDDYDDNVDDDFDDDETSVVDCPECGQPVYEMADRCPHCGNYIVPSNTNPLAGRPIWWVVLGLLGIVAVIAAFMMAI